MCNLYKMTAPREAIARLFRAAVDPGLNYAAELYPGYQGLVLSGDRARAMTWGFPVRLRGMKPESRPKPVTNARDDKLDTPFWRDSFARRRCLVPVTQWAEPEGPAGRMTRTWYSLPGEEIMAVAGLWRDTAEWGCCYTLVMTQSSPAMAQVHDRMPVILRPKDWARWTHGSPDEAAALVQTWEGPLAVERTAQAWVERAGKGGR